LPGDQGRVEERFPPCCPFRRSLIDIRNMDKLTDKSPAQLSEEEAKIELAAAGA
jgi:hypothetical protein